MQDRRGADRRLPECELFVYDDAIDHPLGLVSDMTATGCKLKSTCPVKVGKLYKCRLIFPQLVFGITEISFMAQVKWCHECDIPDEFEMGLEFQDLTEKERMMLAFLIIPWDTAVAGENQDTAESPTDHLMVFEERREPEKP